MNIRKPLSVLAFFALTAPLAAYADAPSGDFLDAFPMPDASAKAPSSADREANRNYVEVSIADLVRSDSTHPVTREDVRRELAASPLPRIEA
jgi:hypothetical protein